MAAAKKRPKKTTAPAPKEKTEKKIDFGVAVEPSVRVFTDWTPSRIRSAELAADGGHLRQAANLCDWIIGDDRFGPLLHQRAQALLGLDPAFTVEGDGRRTNRVVTALEQDWPVAYPEDQLAQFIIWGVLLGAAPGRHGWVRHESRNRLLPMPAFWHPQHLRYDWGTREWRIKVATTAGTDPGTERVLNPGDGSWLLHTPYGPNRPWALGLWRGLARLALLKAYAVGDWARTGERSAMLVATSGDKEVQTSREVRQQLAQDIYERGKEAVIVLPTTFDLKLVETTANTRDIYLAQIDMANTAAAIAIRGGNLTTEVKTGSLAAVESQERLGDQSKRRFDAQALATTTHNQSLRYWAKFNFGDPNTAPWTRYPVKERSDLSKKAATMDKAATALDRFLKLGFEVDGEAFADEFELSAFLKQGKTPLRAAPEPTKPAAPDPETDESDDENDKSTTADDDAA